MRIIIILASVLACTATAGTIEKVEFPETLKLGEHSLLLNGMGLRSKRKLGMEFRVYVAGLYVKAKTNDEQKLIGDGEAKVIDMVFLRSLDKDTIVESWAEQITGNCKVNCDKIKDSMKPFLESLTAVKDKSRMRLAFDKKGVILTAGAAPEMRIDDPSLATNLLAVFFGANPPTPELKKGLLGL